MHCAYIGLGSNLESPVAQVRQALDELGGLPLSTLVAQSSLYATPPVGPQDQPDFINAVAVIKTALSPLALLDQLQALEQRHRRQRLRHWGPRTLDLDLLLYGQQTIERPRLKVPHPYMHERAFVLVPLAEVASAVGKQPLMLHQQTLAHWLTQIDHTAIKRLSNADAR
ncbi:2-amino-4-hydroxy-6-hydroxymethyldihydropteridine diphosphokinase [Halomonas sp. 7T]|uniref:2-amino-4-hydroxy-6- hydroxymethyldihydropteridine diphosphokinase n=1 Tax=Halomonas sp. 7T TaxID=2893469 RepID=UPI0021DB1916|nr:2-amino-4-hydroxy-6-hydroxymethyldihydropteridine diphosphokinase [Halomonas sp. 7T]UXZ56172.1 2-amino-4-hydroxy-6-hydroxymethyldihydropteridine diphosphokinase [Halomonas sp. 7T]